ncbi:hypothetical protein JTE90_005237 [Oedothorax gibbosus]|uniref:Uncharacterized protein n=1 Tax=Oedothorax gibbosus TaxID=931172 RepID=A0AAV6TRQ6_9ARAC|nr:hypothetical protein JTE90_005237 [Oedothorax gibbosus]
MTIKVVTPWTIWGKFLQEGRKDSLIEESTNFDKTRNESFNPPMDEFEEISILSAGVDESTNLDTVVNESFDAPMDEFEAISLPPAGVDNQTEKDFPFPDGHSNIEYEFRNLDGVAAFKNAKGSLWPILLTINGLEPEIRFNNVILAGLWFGKKEPDMNLFLAPFVEEATELATKGISVEPGRTLHVFAACCCSDSVARPCLQNSTQYNGYYGCSWGKHPGYLTGNNPQSNMCTITPYFFLIELKRKLLD